LGRGYGSGFYSLFPDFDSINYDILIIISLPMSATKRFLLVHASPLALPTLSGCFSNLADTSPLPPRDCDSLGLKVLRASYDQAGQNQGRPLSFASSTDNR